MYQNPSNLGRTEEVTKPSLDGMHSFGAPAQQESQTVLVDPEIQLPNSKNSAKGPTSAQLIICLIVMFLLVMVLVWFLGDIGEHFERIQRRLGRRWRKLFGKEGEEISALVEFPIARGDLPPSALGTRKPETDLDEDSEEHSHTAFLESERRSGKPEKLDVALSEIHTLKHSLAALESQLVTAGNTKTDLDRETNLQIEIQNQLAQERLIGVELAAREWESKATLLETLSDSLQKKLELAETDFETQAEQTQAAESKIEAAENEARKIKNQLDELRENSGTQGSQIDSLKQELADQTDDIERLQAALDEALAGATEKTGLLESSESQYQKLADELAESKRSQDQTQTELAAAKEELQSLTSKTVRVEQEMETAYQEMLKKGGLVTELESKVASFETLAESLQKKLELAESDLESQLKQTQTAESKIQTTEADANQLKEQLELQRESLASENSQVDSLKKELADRDSELEKLLKDLDEAQASTKQQTENFEQTKKELDSANQEVTGLKSEVATAEAALERNIVLKLQLEEANAKTADSLKQSNSLAAEIDDIKNQLEIKTEELAIATSSIQTQYDDELAELKAHSENLEKRVQVSETQLAETSDLLAKEQSLHEELKKSAQEDNDELGLQVSKCSELYARVESLEEEGQKTQHKLAEAMSLLEQEKSTRAELETTNKLQTEELSVLASRNSDLESKFAPLETRAQETERKLEETENLLKQEQALLSEIKNSTIENTAELNLETTKRRELESNVELLEDQAKQTQLKLDQATSQLEQQQEALSLKESEHLELQTKLDELAASHADKLVAESRKLERQGLKLDELRLALENERTQRSAVDEELEASLTRVVEFEKQADSASANESNYNELAQKVVKYKTAYRKNKALIEELADQKTKMSDLATEYLAAAKILRKDLDAQLEVNAELKQKLSQASPSGSDQADLKRLVEQRARTHVLKLKSQFEERLKAKNDLIRRLQNHEAQHSDSQ